MTGREVLEKTWHGPVDDAHWDGDTRFFHGDWRGRCDPGGGLILALRAAAGLWNNAPWGPDACRSYCEAYGELSRICGALVPLEPDPLGLRPRWQRGRESGEVKTWASTKSDDERRAMLARALEALPA